MPKVVKPLTDKEIKASKPKEKEYKLSDGQSLYLVVKTNGTKFFRYDFTFENKRKSMSFGVYPETSLSEARILRDKTRELLKQKINPIIDKNLSNINNDNTFKSICDKWLSRMKNDKKSNGLTEVENACVLLSLLGFKVVPKTYESLDRETAASMFHMMKCYINRVESVDDLFHSEISERKEELGYK